MAEGIGWLLNLDGRHRAAVGQGEMVHLIETPALMEVPGSPFHCRQALLWEELLLPAMDLAAWLEGQPTPRHQTLAGICAYQPPGATEPAFGALLLADFPRRLRVDDEQASDLPEQPPGWRELAISCFDTGDGAIPILDLPYIFSGALLHFPPST